MTQLSLTTTAFNNHSLFSDFYLEEMVKEEPHWQKMVAVARGLRQRVANVLEEALPGLIVDTPEAEVERRLIRPILDILGHHYYAQKNVRTSDGQKVPDYGFFASEAERARAETQRGEAEFYKGAIAVGEAKRWDRPLDRRIKGPGDTFTNHNPSFQIDCYLRATDKRWGILTNGRLWRLYQRDLSYRLDVYYEVNLPELVKLDDQAFLFFAAFFCRDAFIPDSTGELFLNRAYAQSTAYAAKLGEELRENVYEAVRLLTEGFLRFPANRLTPAELGTIREHAFTAIYRLLFMFYGESPRKGEYLLPMDSATYRDTYSLRALAEEIARRLDARTNLSPTATGYWFRLLELFRLINEGDPHLGVPAYNGGLFDDVKHPFLSAKRVGDSYLARAIDLLARAAASGRTGRGFVTYGDLGVRELGSIYEGLLEHQPRIAEEPMVAIRDDKRERVVPEREAQGKKVLARYDTNEVYLTLHQGERKATGSYYTPDYIVKYIVQNTLGPLVDELHQQEKDLLNGVLALKVLDPAMGSGHFLVEATDFLARALVEALGGDPQGMEEDEIRWARREVVERCIYGVDLNPLAVELAKLSLWLHTVSRNKPLSFLDHHLRCGNSLIGAWVNKLGVLPQQGKKSKAPKAVTTLAGYQFASAVAAAVNSFYQIMEAPSNTIEDIHRKESDHKTARYALSRVKDIENAWASFYFGNHVNADEYESLLMIAESGTGDWPKSGEVPWLDTARETAEARRFFHWELEFPDIFFDNNGQRLHNPGFSAVVGNPPYDVIAEKEQGIEVGPDKNFYADCVHLEPALGQKLNYYRLFSALSVWLTQQGGGHGFIVPMALIGDAQAAPLRKHILTNSQLLAIEAFPQKDNPKERVFEDAKLSTCVYVLRKQKPIEPFVLRIHSGKFILDTSPQTKVRREDIELLDPHGLSIPCMPGTTAGHISLGIELAKRSSGHRFGEIAPSQQGEVNLTTHSMFLSGSPVGPEVLRGAHVDRYQLNEEPKQGTPAYLKVAEFLRGSRRDSKVFDHQHRRIGYQRGAAIDNWRRIIPCVIEPGNFCSDTINYIVRPMGDFYFALGLLGSSLYEWRFRLTSTNNHVNSYGVDALPLRPINFSTPKTKRERLVKHGKELYEEYIQTKDADKVLSFLGQCLPQKSDGSPDTECEQSDVVHDLLAFLANEMTRLHKEKQSEAKGFHTWLEGYLGVNVEDLKNKTKVKEYWKGDVEWEGFLSTLERNRKAIQLAKGIDVSRRDPQETIRTEFDASVAKLRPLLGRIELTDKLIDQIVYKLYGLTEEEIAVVERQA